MADVIDSIVRLRKQTEDILTSIGADADGPGYTDSAQVRQTGFSLTVKWKPKVDVMTAGTEAMSMFAQAPIKLLDVLRVLEGFAKGPDDHVLSVVTSPDGGLIIECSDCSEELEWTENLTAHELTWLERYHHEALPEEN